MNGSAARDIAVPHFVGRYEVLVPIASGGMATVYLARARGAGGFEREVALKLTHAHLRESPEFQTLLIQEAKLASSIHHHNVVSVLDVGDDPLGLFLVMDYVEGDTLSGLIRRGRAAGEEMPRPLAMRALLDSFAGLHAAHETRDAEGHLIEIVHRDFSPQNILVGTDGVAKLTDFGIAKAASRAGHTSSGMIKGKVGYMSPEQARGTGVDRRSDVWAAGVLTWEITAGRQLWSREEEDVTTLIKLVTKPPPRVREVVPFVSDALDAAIARALSMDPDERWPTAAAFARAIAAITDVAEADELGAYVRRVVGPKIAQRRQQVRSMGELRAQMGEIVELTSMTPSVHLVPPRTLEGSQASRFDVDIDATEFSRAPRFDEPVKPPSVTPPDEPSASALRLTSAARGGSRRVWVIAAIAAAAVLGVVAIVASTREADPVGASAVATATAATAMASAPEPEPEPAAAIASAPVPVVSATASIIQRPMATVPIAAPRAPRKSGRPTATPPQLAPSPY